MTTSPTSKIEGNTITDLWTSNGGGIGILVGTRDGGTHGDNTIKKNKVEGTLFVYTADVGGYDGVGIVLFTDIPGPGDLTGNKIEGNKIDLISDTPGTVNVNGIELTDGRPTSVLRGVISGNTVKKNKIGTIGGDGIVVTGSPGNTFEKNKIGTSGGAGIFDDTVGTGTGSTDNTYKKNKCDTSSPAGLC